MFLQKMKNKNIKKNNEKIWKNFLINCVTNVKSSGSIRFEVEDLKVRRGKRSKSLRSSDDDEVKPAKKFKSARSSDYVDSKTRKKHWMTPVMYECFDFTGFTLFPYE